MGNTGPSINPGLFNAQITWTPNDIGRENTFDIKFINSGSEIGQDIMYDIMIFDNGNHLAESHREDQRNIPKNMYFQKKDFTRSR